MLNIKTSTLLASGFLLLVLFSGCSSSKSSKSSKTSDSSKSSDSIQVTKIWDQGAHHAFTDLIRFNGAFYCTFREGTAHVSGWDGKARVLRSTDGKAWNSIALLSMDNRDVRDPKISLSPDNRLMVLMDVEAHDKGQIISRKPYVSFSDKAGNNFSSPTESAVDPKMVSASDWIWRVTWNKGEGYGIDYQVNGLFLMKTKDGSSFEKVSKINLGGNPNESTIRFDKNNKMYVVIRREEADRMGILATSNPPYQDWKFDTIKQRLGGPNFLFLNDNTLVIGSRLYPSAEMAGQGNTQHKSGVIITDLNGNIKKVIKLPSGGDTSYPGMVIYDGKLWYSYYSSHEGKTAIYLATIPLSQLRS
ncbi:MAG: hypothetical protein ABI151_08960 [Chitinophagaceae bacterium]